MFEFPALPDFLKQGDVEFELRKLTNEYLGSTLRTLLIDAPVKAGERFMREVLLPDFQNLNKGR